MITRNKLGRLGEKMAAEFLERNGYRIIEKNFRNNIGEIDIIAEDKGTLCFVEVKTRDTDLQGSPFEAVSRRKQRKLSIMALIYLEDKDEDSVEARFDVVAVRPNKDGPERIQIIKNAFELIE